MEDDDLFDEFLEYDLSLGADMVKCPYCGAQVNCSLLADEEIHCPVCGRVFRRSESKGGNV
ncbi:MAG: hypothetical protein J7J25_04150 [Candidatus Omnitrophica bacterium]|nr:hypothetical protein [Candidatus Omnitrophota bacterium]